MEHNIIGFIVGVRVCFSCVFMATDVITLKFPTWTTVFKEKLNYQEKAKIQCKMYNWGYPNSSTLHDIFQIWLIILLCNRLCNDVKNSLSHVYFHFWNSFKRKWAAVTWATLYSHNKCIEFNSYWFIDKNSIGFVDRWFDSKCMYPIKNFGFVTQKINNYT